MKYLSIKYNDPGLQTKDIKEIESVLSQLEEKHFDNLKSLFPTLTIPVLNVELSDDIWPDIERFYNENKFTFNIFRPKGLEHLVKIVNLKGKTKYFWCSKYFNNTGIRLFFIVVIEDLITSHLEAKHNIDREIRIDSGVDGLSKQLLRNWRLSLFAKESASKIISRIEEFSYDNMEDLTFAFKRNIKHLHYTYQRDTDNGNFLISVILELNLYIHRIIAYQTDKNLIGFEEFANDILEILEVVNNSSQKFKRISSKDCSIAKSGIISLLKKCDIDLYQDSKTKWLGFNISNGPKKLFPNLIDTHPRLVCFIDILGFKQLIHEYETQNTSMVLKNLKKAFDSSREIAFNMVLEIIGEDIRNEIEFRMFSDCIIISFPIIEYGIDIKKEFYNLAIILNVFLQTFMKEGFYLRGHMTIGSYYSDENMLFSGALVEAYLNESKTVFPVISINPKIIEQLKRKTDFDDFLPPLSELIIYHRIGNVKHNCILNPFFTFESLNTIDNQINKLFETIMGPVFSEFAMDFSLKTVLEKELEKQGISDLKSEINNEKVKIIEILLNKYNEQLQKSQSKSSTQDEIEISKRIINKYRFLIDLFVWISDKKGESFQFIEI